MEKRIDADKETPRRDVSLDDLIYEALIEKGWLIPRTAEDVLRAVRALAPEERRALPRELSDPYRIIGRLDEACEIAPDVTSAEVEDGLREAGVDEPLNPAYVYVSNEPLDDEPTTDAVKRMIFAVRHLTRQRCYEEALELAGRATRLDPHYWRAWISYGSLLALFGNMDEGEAIFHRVLKDFPDNPKAVAAALHNCAFAEEVRCRLKPSEANFRKILPRYEEALSLDESRANTRVSFFINLALSCQFDKGQRVIEGHLQGEEIFADMALETEERGAREVKTYKFTQVLPLSFRDRLCGTGPAPSRG
jgi:tetratricopeptide (TPR) repeat protein